MGDECAWAGLAVIVPSRGRPDNVRRLVDAWALTMSDSGKVATHLWVVVDYDDPCREEYLQIEAPPGMRLDVREALPRRRLGPALNFAARDLACCFPMVGFMGDDHLPRTRGWDLEIAGALRDLGSGIVYGNDLHQCERLPTAVFMSSDIIRTLGWMVPPDLVHLYIDDAWRELGEAMGRLRYLPDVVIEHLHPDAGKAPWDARYAEVNAPEVATADRAMFQAWRADGLPAAVAKLREAGLC